MPPRDSLAILGRLALFVALIAILTRVGGWGVKALLPGADDTVLFLVREVWRLIVVLVVTWAMGRLEHRTFADYGFPARSLISIRLWQGFAIGLIALSIVLAVLGFLGAFSIHGLALRGPAIVMWALIFAAVFLLVAVFEELRARGYGLHALARVVGFWPAAAISSAYFAWSHVGNANETWLGLANAGLVGLVLCFLLRRTGSLIAPIGFHLAFDWGETYLYGVADSGATAPGHLLTSSFVGPVWLTGGGAGPEGSVVCTVVVLGAWAACAGMFRQTRYRPAG